MVIKTDEEGKIAIFELLDLALKTGGLNNMNGVARIKQSIEIIEETEVKKESEKNG